VSITNFKPEIWSRAILLTLRNKLVFGSLCNRDYEGDISQAGDTVHIINFSDPTISNYAAYGTLTWEQLSDNERALIVDQSKSFSFMVDDIDKKQALPGFIATASTYAAYGLASAMDTFISGLMKAGVDPSNKLGARTVNDAASAYQLLLDLRARLAKSGVPEDGRWVTLPTDVYSYLLQDDRFVRSDSAPGTTVRTGLVGRALGMDVYESQTVPDDGTAVAPATGVFTVVAGHGIATTLAEQIVETEALRLQDSFADGVRGLHVYGGKVVRPTALASADVTAG
jgi:hypothetical protein